MPMLAFDTARFATELNRRPFPVRHELASHPAFRLERRTSIRPPLEQLKLGVVELGDGCVLRHRRRAGLTSPRDGRGLPHHRFADDDGSSDNVAKALSRFRNRNARDADGVAEDGLEVDDAHETSHRRR